MVEVLCTVYVVPVYIDMCTMLLVGIYGDIPSSIDTMLLELDYLGDT